LEILLIIGAVAASYFFLKNNAERSKRFVRAHHFLMQINSGANVDTANRAAQHIFSKGSDSSENRRDIMWANAYAKERYNGRQLPVIAAAISKGFEGAKLSKLEQTSTKNIELPRLGRETGELAIQQLSLPFLLGSHHENGKFSPPNGFFDDPFVGGYIMSFINTFRVHQLNDRELSDDDRNRFMQAALEAADPRLIGADLSKSWVGGLRNNQSEKNAAAGANAASAIVLAMIGKIDESYPDPLIASARDLARARSGVAAEMQNFMPQSSNTADPAATAFVSAIHEVTVGQRMRQRYPELCGP
jgi:hypothetical protein